MEQLNEEGCLKREKCREMFVSHLFMFLFAEPIMLLVPVLAGDQGGYEETAFGRIIQFCLRISPIVTIVCIAIAIIYYIRKNHVACLVIQWLPYIYKLICLGVFFGALFSLAV